MFIDATNPMRDAFETIQATDVISDAKKLVLFQGLEALRRQHCPEPAQAARCCEACLTRHRCLTAVLDLLGS
ncbi:hypothetical protein SAMN02982917_4690 [Azospirillum oryzae]|uniref:Uncharacterized protein n=1 Tax=Azospirillum oryzae TaxID=286727 RepID=A0A1X7H0C9_9PROT|nr:hypothetical protein [Azospirillum oryzae]SMF77418.1 hypothetical protein SAMN02982917_4690 [Azospirillum oryzae]